VCEHAQYTQGDVVYSESLGAFVSLHHHTSFAQSDPTACVAGLNEALESGRQSVADGVDWVFVTLGSSWVYSLKAEGQQGRVVSNCGKLPGSLFSKRMLGVAEVWPQLLLVLTCICMQGWHLHAGLDPPWLATVSNLSLCGWVGAHACV
jgi:hypothetical protein